jgi:hypothetical protein
MPNKPAVNKQEEMTQQDVVYICDLLYDRIDYMNAQGYSQEDIDDTLNITRKLNAILTALK